MSDHTSSSTKELQKAVVDNREALRVIRFGGAGSRSRNVRATRMLRRETARVLTELRARDLSAYKTGIASKAKKA